MPISRFAVMPVFPGSPAPQVYPPLSDADSLVRRWKVTHACDAPAPALAVAQAQLEAGMRASVLTGDSVAPASSRLSRRHPAAVLTSIRQLRRWRRLFAAEQDSEILHAHCVPAGLAAVPGDHVLVYDFRAGVTPRLLRTAERFLLTHAAAVVVHSQALWGEALQRGVPAGNLFLIPDPVELEDAPHLPAFGRSGSVVLFAPGITAEFEITIIVDAFAMMIGEIEGAQLLIETEGELAARVARRAQELEIAPAVRVVAPVDRQRALQEAEIIIAGKARDENPSPSAIAALAHGRALLAADVAQNREVTPQGRGCVWYGAGSARDLACRAAFLARNPDFRAALAASGRAHLAATRGPVAVARLYDEVYRHAWRQRRGGPEDFLRQLQLLQASL